MCVNLSLLRLCILNGVTSPPSRRAHSIREWRAVAERFYNRWQASVCPWRPAGAHGLGAGLPGLKRPVGLKRKTLGSCRLFPGSALDHSCAPAPTATQARSELDTESTLNVLAAAVMRVRA